MGVLRLLSIVSGLAAVFGTVPTIAPAQGAPVEVTSGVIGADSALDGVGGEAGGSGAAALLHVPVEDPELSALAPLISLRPRPRDIWAVPAARWDDNPRGAQWTAAVLAALRGPGASLLQTEPRDIQAWCPGYLEASSAQRAAFWTGLVSVLAWHESTHNPRAVGGGGRWFGLVQIAPGTARWRDCDVGSGDALLNGSANLRCGVRIMGITVPRDNVVAEGMRGVAADWGPFHSARKREDMRNWVRDQAYCAAPPALTRPVMRPSGLGEAASAAPVAGDMLRPVPRPL